MDANDFQRRKDSAADALLQLGRDEMAEALADWLASLDPDDYADGYVDGVEDALISLVNAGAADPR